MCVCVCVCVLFRYESFKFRTEFLVPELKHLYYAEQIIFSFNEQQKKCHEVNYNVLIPLF